MKKFKYEENLIRSVSKGLFFKKLIIRVEGLDSYSVILIPSYIDGGLIFKSVCEEMFMPIKEGLSSSDTPITSGWDRNLDQEERLTKIKIKQAIEALIAVNYGQGFGYFVELSGVGYNLKLENKNRIIALIIGFKDTKRVEIPDDLKAEVIGDTILVIRGANKDKVTQYLAKIRQMCASEKFKYKKKGFSKMQTIDKLLNKERA